MRDYKVTVPEGKAGAWRVERFTVTPEASRHAAIFREIVPAGDYTRLKRGPEPHGTVVMSDTPEEYRDHRYAIYQARGKVLINGLGLGMYLQAVLRKPEVIHATVIEKAPEVIQLVAPHYLSMFGPDRLTVIQADALTWQPEKGARYDVVWHDIWDAPCSDLLPEMHKLHRRYGRRCGWQGSWKREYIEAVLLPTGVY